VTARRLVPVAVVAALAAVPLSVQTYGTGETSFVFLWGLVGLDPLHVTTLPDYLGYAGGAPGYVRAWPLTVLLWAAALAAALVDALTDRGDARVTAGLLVLAGVTALRLSSGFSVQPGRTAYATGTGACWAVAAWRWWRARP
jgi:uncharacterized protein (TIGR04206 family)